MTASKSYAQHLRDKLVASRKENEKLILENAQLRNFQARAELSATEITLLHLDKRTLERQIDGKIAEYQKSERRMDFYWESCDMLREMAEVAQTNGDILQTDKVLEIINRPDTEGLFD